MKDQEKHENDIMDKTELNQGSKESDNNVIKNIDESLDEKLLEETTSIEIKRSNLFFIDDEVSRESNRRPVESHDDELDKLSSNIAVIIEGDAKQLQEADPNDDNEFVYSLSDTRPTFADLLVDIKEKQTFIDDELDFIDDSFVTEDADALSTFIDETIEPEKMDYKLTIQDETLGLFKEEFTIIEDRAFQIEYKDINFDEVIHTKVQELDNIAGDISIKNINYILPISDSLRDYEKISIEKDLITQNALIIEEDVEKIKRRLQEYLEETVQESIKDITNDISIIEDETDLNNLLGKSSEKKLDDIRMLLKYLNGLFEDLPESNIKEFAESEYFDLYSKILNDLDK